MKTKRLPGAYAEQCTIQYNKIQKFVSRAMSVSWQNVIRYIRHKIVTYFNLFHFVFIVISYLFSKIDLISYSHFS